MEAIKTFVNSLPAGLIPLILASPLISVFQSKIHKWLSVQSSKVKMLISLVLSILVVLIPHWIGLLKGDATLMGAYTSAFLTGMTLFYNFILKEKPSLDVDLSPNVIAVPETLPEPTAQTAPAQTAPAETAAEFGPEA
jgi:hypothetical protein